jgi:hypothetical protein
MAGVILLSKMAGVILLFSHFLDIFTIFNYFLQYSCYFNILLQCVLKKRYIIRKFMETNVAYMYIIVSCPNSQFYGLCIQTRIGIDC